MRMKNIKKAFDYVDKNFDSMIEELREVCSYRSVEGDQEGLRQTREYILRKMKDIGLNTELHEVPEGNPIIFSEKEGMLNNTLLFYNHYDVVPEGPVECWKHHPFECEIENGKLYARGVSDNKGGLFSRLHAIQAITSAEKELPIGVKFLVEGDEESCSPSLYKFAEENQGLFKNLISADGCIWENGRKDENGYPWARFGVRGGLEAELSVKTSEKDIHERNGAIVPNAAWRLVWALASIKDKNENVLIEGFYDDVLDLTEQDKKVLEDFPYNEQELKDNIGIDKYLLDLKGYDLKKRLYAEPAVTINGIESGKMYETIRSINPHYAYARVHFSLAANQDPERIKILFRRHLDKNGFSDVHIEYKGQNTPVRTPVDVRLKDIIYKAAELVYQKPMVLELTALGGGPGILFRKHWPDMPIIGIGPASTGSGHHSPDENLVLEDYKEAIKHIIALLYTYAEMV